MQCGLWAWEERVECLATGVEQAVKERGWMGTGRGGRKETVPSPAVPWLHEHV